MLILGLKKLTVMANLFYYSFEYLQISWKDQPFSLFVFHCSRCATQQTGLLVTGTRKLYHSMNCLCTPCHLLKNETTSTGEKIRLEGCGI